MPETELERLEAWTYGHKSRSVEISRDNGYGATCWEVHLWGNGKELEVTECFFFKNAIVGRVPEAQCGKRELYVHAVEEGEDFDDWPGLAKTVGVAIDRAVEYGL